eukprot:1806777-Pyramimonas_sp.AAC.1
MAPRFSSSSETPRLPAGQAAPSRRGGRAEAFGVSAFSGRSKRAQAREAEDPGVGANEAHDPI